MILEMNHADTKSATITWALFVDRIRKYPNKREAIPPKKIISTIIFFVLNLNLEGQATTTQANGWATPTPPPPPPPPLRTPIYGYHKSTTTSRLFK